MNKQIPPEPPSSEITPEPLYLSRREFMKNGALTLGTAAVVGGSLVWLAGKGPPPDPPVPPCANTAHCEVTPGVFASLADVKET